jgi:hypothetical protein
MNYKNYDLIQQKVCKIRQLEIELSNLQDSGLWVQIWGPNRYDDLCYIRLDEQKPDKFTGEAILLIQAIKTKIATEIDQLKKELEDL